MFNACMNMNAGNAGPPPGHLGSVPQPNGPPNLGGPTEPAGFYSSAPPHFNNNQIRPPNIAPRPNYCPPIYEFKVYELTKRLTERPEVGWLGDYGNLL